MAASKRSVVVGVFQDRTKAQQAVEELRRVGFQEDQIGVVSRDEESNTGTATASSKGATVGMAAAGGAATGAGVGALWALGIAAGFLPAIGPVIAGGIFASILASAAGGAATGGVLGALIGLGIPEAEANYYHGEFEAGRTLVTIKAHGRYDEAYAILHRYGAYDQMTAPTPAQTSAKTKGDATVQVHEEQLHAHKQPVQTGEVRVRKDVVTENKTIDVPVQREEIIVERHATSGHKATDADIRAGEEIRIPVKEEQVHVEKETVVTGEVNVSKRKVQDTAKVGGTVRKEEVKVDTEGEVKVRDDDSAKSKRR